VLITLGEDDFKEDGRGRLTRWTGRLPTSAIHAELVAPQTSKVTIEILEGLSLPKESGDVHLFSIRGDTPNWTPLYASGDSNAIHAGDAEGMLVSAAILDDGQKQSWCCSGVMVTPNLFLTNWHCGGTSPMPESAYWNTDVCANSLIDLGWDEGPVRRQYNCVAVERKNRKLDYAIIRIRPVVGVGGMIGRPIAAAISSKKPSATDGVFLVHNAQCKSKRLSSHCHIVPKDSGAASADIAASDFVHDCDTEPGSSGAPVFDSDRNLVGLHHLGFARDANCAVIDHQNKAVSIQEILNDIHNDFPFGFQ
jgi:hypothetical protein